MKQWYSSSELAGLPGLPLHRGNVTRKAVAEGWQFRQRNGQGGGP
ncbi:DNA-binding protein [Synechocystis sp. PCC 7509]|nr:DNA-binding protein [Synechocystis sp. PCC 7509]